MTTPEEGLSKEDQEKVKAALEQAEAKQAAKELKEAEKKAKTKAPAKKAGDQNPKTFEVTLEVLQAERVFVRAPGGDLYRLANMGRDTYTLQLWKRK